MDQQNQKKRPGYSMWLRLGSHFVPKDLGLTLFLRDTGRLGDIGKGVTLYHTLYCQETLGDRGGELLFSPFRQHHKGPKEAPWSPHDHG